MDQELLSLIVLGIVLQLLVLRRHFLYALKMPISFVCHGFKAWRLQWMLFWGLRRCSRSCLICGLVGFFCFLFPSSSSNWTISRSSNWTISRTRYISSGVVRSELSLANRVSLVSSGSDSWRAARLKKKACATRRYWMSRWSRVRRAGSNQRTIQFFYL